MAESITLKARGLHDVQVVASAEHVLQLLSQAVQVAPKNFSLQTQSPFNNSLLVTAVLQLVQLYPLTQV